MSSTHPLMTFDLRSRRPIASAELFGGRASEAGTGILRIREHLYLRPARSSDPTPGADERDAAEEVRFDRQTIEPRHVAGGVHAVKEKRYGHHGSSFVLRPPIVQRRFGIDRSGPIHSGDELPDPMRGGEPDCRPSAVGRCGKRMGMDGGMEEQGTLLPATSGAPHRRERTEGYQSSQVARFILLEVGRVLLYDA